MQTCHGQVLFSRGLFWGLAYESLKKGDMLSFSKPSNLNVVKTGSSKLFYFSQNR